MDHHPAIVRKPGQDGESRVRIEHVAVVAFRHVFVIGGKGGHLPVDIDTERVAHVDGRIGF